MYAAYSQHVKWWENCNKLNKYYNCNDDNDSVLDIVRNNREWIRYNLFLLLIFEH